MIYHATGHKLQCQLEYHPEKITGFGMTDGEGTERLNWKLQPFFTSLKEVRHTKGIKFSHVNLNLQTALINR